MEEIRPSLSPSPPPPQTDDGKREKSALSQVKKECLSFAVSLQESFRYIKAKFVGQAKKITAGNEKEATAANLQASKMEVEAADEAESTKNKLDKSL